MEEAAEEQLPAPLPLAAAALPHPAAPGGGRHHLLLLLLGSKQLLRYNQRKINASFKPESYQKPAFFPLF